MGVDFGTKKVNMRSEDDYLLEIEGVLVNEFRICQSLLHCMKEERKALSSANLESLFLLVERREEILEEMEAFEIRREDLVHAFARNMGLELDAPRLSDCLSPLAKPPVERIGRLSEGISALKDSLSSLGEWNYALADSVLNREESVQAFLLNLYPPVHPNRPPV